ncbi:universal stress protein, partial [Streptomyces sp. NPDC059766]|uniref:universal stress protein n=1 Tax=Streptomyces sp. NPDC059766 TaxID=3346940 RepID=UPI00365B92D0
MQDRNGTTGTTDQPVVAGVDGSAPSLRAVDRAAEEAALRGLPLRLVYASLWERYEGSRPAGDPDRPSEEMLAEDIVTRAARRAHDRRPEVKVTTEVLPE